MTDLSHQPGQFAELERLCSRYSLWWHACPDTRHCRGPKGFPDLVIAGPSGLLFAEMKGLDQFRTPEQICWHAALGISGAKVFTWKEAEFANGMVEGILASIS